MDVSLTSGDVLRHHHRLTGGLRASCCLGEVQAITNSVALTISRDVLRC